MVARATDSGDSKAGLSLWLLLAGHKTYFERVRAEVQLWVNSSEKSSRYSKDLKPAWHSRPKPHHLQRSPLSKLIGTKPLKVSTTWHLTEGTITTFISIYIYIYGFFNVRTGVLDYLREGFPWPARPFKHTETHTFRFTDGTGVSYYTSGASPSRPPSTY